MNPLRSTLLAIFTLGLLFSLANSALADETKGKFKNALADKESLVVTEQEKDCTFKLGANAKIVIDDREATLADLKAGDMVTVVWQERDGQKIASRITCKRS